jgi:hypothetical protein
MDAIFDASVATGAVIGRTVSFSGRGDGPGMSKSTKTASVGDEAGLRVVAGRLAVTFAGTTIASPMSAVSTAMHRMHAPGTAKRCRNGSRPVGTRDTREPLRTVATL